MPRPRRIPQHTLDEIVRQRMFSASFGQIAKVCRVSIVPIPGGGYRIVTF
jgi:hypothetical protein